MKVSPVSSPHAMLTPQSGTSAAADSRARAIAMLSGNQSPVQNQNAISAEEVKAIKPTEDEVNEESAGQLDASEATNSGESEQAAPEETKVEDPALSRQFAQLARQEKALRLKAQQQEQAWKAKEQALAAREAEMQAQLDQYKTGYVSREQLKADPFSVLNDNGLTYEQLTEQLLNPVQRDPRMEATISKLEAKIKELEAKTEDTGKQYKQQQADAYQAAVRQIEADVKSLVQSDPEFETIKATNSMKDVVELITQTYDKDGVLLTVEEAAKEVESYLMEEALKLAQISKIKSRMAQNSASSSQAAASKPASVNQPKQQQPMKTLTNAASGSRQLSARERALLAFKGELKS